MSKPQVIEGFVNPDPTARGRGNWIRRPDGTLIRLAPPWESAGALRARAGMVDHDEDLVGVIDETDVWCSRCGYSFEIHEPDGCPTEAEAREAYGR